MPNELEVYTICPDLIELPSIHIRISAAGYKTLVTQYYPLKGKIEDTFDLVLLPER